MAAASWTATDPKYAAIVMDASNGEVLYAKNADAQRYPASITKIMTLYLTFQALESGKLKLTDRVPVSRFAASMQPSKLGVAPGGSVSVDEAMRALAVISANGHGHRPFGEDRRQRAEVHRPDDAARPGTGG